MFVAVASAAAIIVAALVISNTGQTTTSVTFNTLEATAPPLTSTPITISSNSQILFDESHGGLSLDPNRAATLVPTNPEFAYAGIFAKEIKRFYTLNALIDGPITPDVLKAHRVLILVGLDGWYSSHEVDTILNFVRSGGGLLIVGEGGDAGSLSLITEPMGVSFFGGPIASEAHRDFGDFEIKVNTTNILLDRVSELTLHDATAIEVKSPAITLISTEANTWIDLNVNGVKDSNEKVGPFSIAAQIQFGQGRVLIFPNSVWGGYFNSNATFLMQALEWLANQ